MYITYIYTYMKMCVCICIYEYIYMYIYVFSCTYTCINGLTFLCKHDIFWSLRIYSKGKLLENFFKKLKVNSNISLAFLEVP